MVEVLVGRIEHEVVAPVVALRLLGRDPRAAMQRLVNVANDCSIHAAPIARSVAGLLLSANSTLNDSSRSIAFSAESTCRAGQPRDRSPLPEEVPEVPLGPAERVSRHAWHAGSTAMSRRYKTLSAIPFLSGTVHGFLPLFAGQSRTVNFPFLLASPSMLARRKRSVLPASETMRASPF